jgi:hypothetical protein
MPNAKPFPLYTDGASIYYTTDGVNFNSLGTGGTPPTGTGFQHVTSGVEDSAAVAIDGTLIASPTLGLSGWWANAQRFLAGKLPALTEFVPWKAGVAPIGAPAAGVTGNGLDANVEGGGLKGGGSTTVTPLSFTTVWQTPKTGPLAMIVRAKFPAVSAALQSFGAINAAQTHAINFSLASGVDATHWYFALNDGTQVNTALSVADTSWHDFAFTFDGVTVTCWVDGVSVGTVTTLTHFPTDALAPYIINGASAIAVTKALWGYVAA